MGGGLYAYDAVGPDLHGYRVTRDLCLDARLTSLRGLLGPEDAEPMAASDEGEAVDRATCRVHLGPAPADSAYRAFGGGSSYSGQQVPTDSVVDLTYVLHRRTDPATEFDQTVKPIAPGDSYAEHRIDGLGSRAYLLTDVGGGPPQLKVLDGQAEFTVEVHTYDLVRHGDSVVGDQYIPERVAENVLAPALTRDVENLMATLKGR